MNQINGYCQIELPDRISLDAIEPNTDVKLTDAEVKPIIKALNLDHVLANDSDNGYASYINAWLNKPAIVTAYITTEDSGRDVKSIFHASVVSRMSASDTLRITFLYPSSNGDRIAELIFTIDGGKPGEYAKWGITLGVSTSIK